MGTINYWITSILQNIFYVQHKKETHTGLRTTWGCMSKWWQNVHFCVNFPLKSSSWNFWNKKRIHLPRLFWHSVSVNKIYILLACVILWILKLAMTFVLCMRLPFQICIMTVLLRICVQMSYCFHLLLCVLIFYNLLPLWRLDVLNLNQNLG